ncbi:hypothetical protein PUN28_018503 [Cardiocondyla obscurior]|uniref:Secreted protein n=1 Tax=Cardiocondyla obscurior TaxID=286306 RepID=A0AAW2EGC3_9HYME
MVTSLTVITIPVVRSCPLLSGDTKSTISVRHAAQSTHAARSRRFNEIGGDKKINGPRRVLASPRTVGRRLNPRLLKPQRGFPTQAVARISSSSKPPEGIRRI